MAFALDDRVKETSTTTGTGTYDLVGAVTGFQTFVAGIATGNTCYYSATDGTNWEVGIGTITDATPDTLARTTILSSSNADAAVNWAAGTRTLAATFPAYAVLNKGLARSPQVYTATGASTWSKTTGLSYVIVEAIGGGGGGGGCGGSQAGSAGGAGGYARRAIAAASLGATETATVGGGGAAGITGGAGGAGTSSTFGSFMTACGGAPGVTGGTWAGSLGGTGGLATSGDINIQGGDGGYAAQLGVSSATAFPGQMGGNGGGGYFGGGGMAGVKGGSGAAITGQAGKAKGSGGAGGVGASGTGAAGGAGANGIIIVWEFI